jgi:hypothetical protein
MLFHHYYNPAVVKRLNSADAVGNPLGRFVMWCSFQLVATLYTALPLQKEK